jgi:hypothetical protein
VIAYIISSIFSRGAGDRSPRYCLFDGGAPPQARHPTPTGPSSSTRGPGPRTVDMRHYVVSRRSAYLKGAPGPDLTPGQTLHMTRNVCSRHQYMLIAVARRGDRRRKRNHRRHDTSHNTHSQDFRTVCTLCTLQSHPPPRLVVRSPSRASHSPSPSPTTPFPFALQRHTHGAHRQRL